MENQNTEEEEKEDEEEEEDDGGASAGGGGGGTVRRGTDVTRPLGLRKREEEWSGREEEGAAVERGRESVERTVDRWRGRDRGSERRAIPRPDAAAAIAPSPSPWISRWRRRSSPPSLVSVAR